MRLLFLALACLALTTASSIHYSPASSSKIYLVKSEDRPTRQYHEQDSGGFYSYGYSADRSAKAEYLTVDGSAKGFYSYVDANGKLQTVKYEAGREKGFKAAATNLPKAPKNPNRQGPAPVKDTPEVAMAKKAHFEAYREAAMRAALESDSQQHSDENGEGSEELRQRAEAANKHSREEFFAILSANRNREAAAAAAAEADNSNESVESAESGERGGNDENASNGLSELQQDDDRNEAETASDAKSTNGHRQMTTYTIQGRPSSSEEQLDSRLVYSLDDSLLSELNQKTSLDFLQPSTVETVRVPVHSYYTVLAPTTKYSVVTPTILTSVPREESLKRGHSLPISLSTSFLSHRIKTN